MAEGKDGKSTNLNKQLSDSDTSNEEPIDPKLKTSVDLQEPDQQDSEILEDQISRTSQDDNYQTAIDEDEQDDMIQFGNLVTQPFLSRSGRVPITEVGFLNFTQMLQDYL